MAPTILVVDDHGDTRTLITRLLRRQGYAVSAVADGQAALSTAKTQQPDLVIVDVIMPGMDGLHVIDTLRQHDPLLPVIAMSAVHDVLEHQEWVPSGIDPGSVSFLAKPFGLAALLVLVHQLLPLAVVS